MLLLVLCRFVQTSAAVLLAGTAVLRLLAWGAGMERQSLWTRLAWSSWGVLLLAGVCLLGLTAAEMSGRPLGQALSGAVLATVLQGTSFGSVWQVRMWLLAALGMTLLFLAWTTAPRRAGSRVTASLELTMASLAAAVLVTLIWAGHAHASGQRAWLLPNDVLHVLAAGCWPGGLWPLALLLARTRRDPALVQPALKITRRFSRLSLAAVLILALSGWLNAVGLVGAWAALWPSTYGRLILGKVALLAALVAFGAVNRRLLRPEAPGNAAQTLQTLWRNVAWECVLAICVLVATETLAMNAPPAST